VIDTISRCLGWVTQYNPLSVEKGALIRAENCRLGRENLIEARRGHALYSTLSNNLTRLMVYSGRVLAQNSTTISYDNGSGTFANYSGSYTAPTATRMRYMEASSNLYFTTNAGVKVMTDVAGTAARSAGVPRALGPSYALNAAGSGFLSNGNQCAYRCTIQRTDANSNVITGYPSERLWVTNSAGSGKNVDLTIYLPSEAIANDVMIVYRSEQVVGTSSDTAGDELGLVYRYKLTSSDITTGYITFTDSVVDALIGETIYTAPSQEGIAQANDRPPLCKDLALFRDNYMFYANCSTKQRLTFSLVGTGSLSGATITLAGVTYNFGASEIISGGGSPQVNVSATGTAAVDIENTARSLVRVINRYAGNTSVYAYYLSGPEDLPGQIMIEERGVGGSAFTIQASASGISGMFFPAPPVSPSTSTDCTSSNSTQRNALYFSKQNQPEHVPLLNYILAGPSNKGILRVVALRDSLIVVKEEGVYQVTGDSPSNFSVRPLDLTVQCKADNSVCVLANQVFMLSNQGVVSISDTGVSVVSRDIEPEISPLLTYSNLSTYTTGAAYESDRTYLLSTVSTSSDSAPNQTFVYNVFTKQWALDTFGFIDAVVEPSVDKLFYAKSSDPKVYRERKDFSDTDFADPESSITITAISTANNTVTFTGAAPEVGYVVSQGGTGLAISSYTSDSNIYTAVVDGDIPDAWATGAASLFPNVDAWAEWAPWSGASLSALKQGRALCFVPNPLEGESSVSQLVATFRGSNNDEVEEIEINAESSGWGEGAWGEFGWGGTGALAFPTLVPREMGYFQWLIPGVKSKQAQKRMSIAAVCMAYELAGESGGGR
jgi:hypothetical protein